LPSTLASRPALHTACFYVAFFMMTGVHVPFWPLWLEDWGLTAAEVGTYTALGFAVRTVAGLAIPAFADRVDARRAVVVVCAAVSALLFLAHLGITTRPALLAATLAIGTSLAGLGPLTEALGVAAARVRGFPYAVVRGIGSAGYLAANLGAGVAVALFGSGILLWWIVACLVAVALLGVRHPGGGRVAGRAPPRLREIGRLLVHPAFALFTLAVGALQASHAVMYALGTLHWHELGIGEGEIGALWGASVGVEIVFLLTIGGATVAALGPVRALLLAGVAGVVRWGAMMADPTGLLLWPIQALHVLTFALAHLGTIAFISRAVPERYAAAAQGATASMAAGGLMALAMLLASAVYDSLGGLTYGISAALSLSGLGLVLLLARRWDGSELAV
jgi:MFS transporter, PPP family, 3-phenylpropionic acid transporter